MQLPPRVDLCRNGYTGVLVDLFPMLCVYSGIQLESLRHSSQLKKNHIEQGGCSVWPEGCIWFVEPLNTACVPVLWQHSAVRGSHCTALQSAAWGSKEGELCLCLATVRSMGSGRARDGEGAGEEREEGFHLSQIMPSNSDKESSC